MPKRKRRGARPVDRWYPEVAVGGYSRVDGSVEFYQRIHALLRPGMRVVDFGAGRGSFLDDPVEHRRELHRLDRVADEVIGLDVDRAVLSNPSLTRAEVIVPGQPLPVESASVDLVCSDWVFEHVADPAWAAAELDRILRPGGWICARTPNRHGYIGLGARAVPNRLHVLLLRAFQPSKEDRDTFPTTYLLNTPDDLAHHFPRDAFDHAIYTMNNEPAYVADWRAGWALAQLAFRLTPQRFGATLYVFLHKR